MFKVSGFGCGLTAAAWVVNVCVMVAPCQAWPTFDWSNPSGGVFSQPSHWNPGGGPPGPGDMARFLLSGSYAVQLTQNTTTSALHADSVGPTLNLAGHSYTVTGGFPNSYFDGQQRITGGSLNTQHAVIDGTLEVDQPSMSWLNNERIYVGYDEHGSLDVHSGAQVTTWRTYLSNTLGVNGTLTIRDPDTYFSCQGGLMIVGGSGNGTLLLTDGAVLDSDEAEIAGDFGTSGLATVSNGAQWNIPETFYIGLKDDGTLNLIDGGIINSQGFALTAVEEGATADILVRNYKSPSPTEWNVGIDLNLGHAGNASMIIESNSAEHQAIVNVDDSMFLSLLPTVTSDLTVTGAGSSLHVNGRGLGVFVVGADGPSTLVIDDGAAVECRVGELAGNFGSQGTATVSDGGSWTIHNEAYFGLKGPGALAVHSGSTVQCNGFASIGDFPQGDGEVLISDVGDTGSAILNTVGDLYVGNFGEGTLTIESASNADDAHVTVGGNLSIARVAGSSGEIAVTGAGSDLQLNGASVGREGVGTLQILQGADISANSVVLAEIAGADGAVLVDESTVADPTTFAVTGGLTVALRGDANFEVLSPATVTATQLMIGETVTSDGTASLHGPDVTATFNQSIYVGQQGTGSLTLDNVNTTTGVLTIADFPSSTGTFNINGGSLVVSTGPLMIGHDGFGTMTASGGAQINCNATPDGLVVAGKPGSFGDLTITDPGTLINVERQFAMERNGITTITNHGILRCRKGVSPTSSAGIIATNQPSLASIHINNHGWLDCVDGFVNVGFRNNTNGTMVVSDSGKVTSVGGFVGREPGAIGQITVTDAGSEWINTAAVTIAELGSGSLTVNNEGLVTAPDLIVGVNGKLEGAGGIITSPVLNKKLVAPGNATSPTGALTVNGNYSQTAAAKLAIDLGGPVPGTTHDQLAVNGNVTLAGTLEIATIKGYAPPAGQTYQVVLACSGCTLSGTFSQVIPAGVYEIIYNADSVIVKVPGDPPACIADIAPDGGNGIVDVDDLLTVINSWSFCPPKDCPADIIVNGTVDVDDLLAVINAWGACP